MIFLFAVVLLSYQEQADSLRALIRRDPQFSYLQQLNQIYQHLGLPDSGIALLAQYLNILPADQRPRLVFQLGLDYFYTGQLTAAREKFLEAAALAPGADFANDALEKIYLLELGRRDTVEFKRLLTVLAQEQYGLPDSVPAKFKSLLEGSLADIAYFNLGRIALLLGQYAEALAAFNELNQKFPDHQFHRVFLYEAEIYLRLADTTRARDRLEEVLVKMPASIYAARARAILKSLNP